MTIKLNGELYKVFDFQHVTPGNWRGMVQTKLKNLKSGSIIEHRFRSEDKVERATTEQAEMEFLYQSGQEYYFMNTESYEQIHIPRELLGDSARFLRANMVIQVEYVEGEPVGIQLPASVELKVVQTEPALRGATVSNVNKPATLENGMTVQVPPFINVGDVVRVDTTGGKYLERA